MGIIMPLAGLLLSAGRAIRGPITDESARALAMAGPSYPKARRFPCHRIVEEFHGKAGVIRLVPREERLHDHLIYLHGGSFALPITGAHWTAIERLVADTDLAVTVPLYARPPHGTVVDAELFLDEVYRTVEATTAPDHISIVGDSAGGTLALSLAERMTRAGRTPRVVIAMAPVLDLTGSGAAITELSRFDPIIRFDEHRGSFARWAADLSLTDPRVSPGHLHDLTGLPPIHLIQGGRDVLAADVLEFAQRLKRAGNTGSLTYELLGTHVYPAVFGSAESKRAFRLMRSVLELETEPRR